MIEDRLHIFSGEVIRVNHSVPMSFDVRPTEFPTGDNTLSITWPNLERDR